MKTKYLITAAGLVLAASLFTSACGSSDSKTAATAAASEETGAVNHAGDGNQAGNEREQPLEKPSGDNGQEGPGNGEAPGGAPGQNGQGGPGGAPGGGSKQPESYNAVDDVTEDTELTGSIDSTGTDENAVHVSNGAAVSIKNAAITRNSDDSTGGDSSSFYGVGATVLTTDGTVYVSGSTIASDAKGGAGVFAYGDNGTAYISDTKITTKQDTSGGIHVAGGGTLYAWNVDAATNGESSAAIRSDRGGGKMVVDGGTYTSNGSGSPAVYSTADLTIHDAALTANGSEAICIEGDNQIRLFDCDLSGNMSDLAQNGLTWNVILYQSMSGDSEVGNSTFEMDGGSLTAKNGGMFYSTNTESTFILHDVDITYAPENDFFLQVTGNSNERGWGKSGANGADTIFTGIDQEMEGNIIWDSISQLDFYMIEGSALKGAVLDDESNAGNGGNGYAKMYIDSTSTWTVTGDSTLTDLYNAGKIVDESGKTVSIVGTDGTEYVHGDSTYTITVSGTYSTDADLSGAGQLDSWSDYEAAKPAELS